MKKNSKTARPAHLLVSLHITTDRLFAHATVGNLQICFENSGAKLAPNAFVATAAHALHDSSDIALGDRPTGKRRQARQNKRHVMLDSAERSPYSRLAMPTRREHPARAAAHRADRKIFATIRATYDVDYAHGWCGPDWEKATAMQAELCSAPAHVALHDAAARAPLYA